MRRKQLNHVQYKRNIHPDFVDKMDKHLNALKHELRAVAHKSVVEYVELSRSKNKGLKELFYKGYVIIPNLTGYVNYDFCKEDCEIIKGHGKSIDDCKIQIDEILEN